jgi:hypothetical protein
LARVEAAQERPFARSPTIGVYASYDKYARANGLEDAAIAAVYRSGRVLLSPTLCGAERARLPGVLTHELSHTHLFGWRSSLFSARPPSWFTEGLAVMVSDGGGAEGVSEVEAAEALRKGYAIVVMDDGLWRDFASIRFEIEPPHDPSRDDFISFRQRLAYRQAGDVRRMAARARPGCIRQALAAHRKWRIFPRFLPRELRRKSAGAMAKFRLASLEMNPRRRRNDDRFKLRTVREVGGS